MAGVTLGILGAGAIGTYLGARLAAAGEDVVLVGRLGAEIAAHGVTLTEEGAPPLHVPAARLAYDGDVARLAPCDVVLVTVKSMATAGAAAELAKVARPGTLVVSFQNGLTNPDVLRRALPRCTVLAGMVPFNVKRDDGGQFHRGTSGALAIERAGGAERPLVTALRHAGLPVDLHADLRPIQATKLLLNLNNAINALAGVPLRAELSDRTYRRALARAIREGYVILRASGIRPARIGRITPRLLPILLPLPDPLFVRVAHTMIRIDAAARSSMADDLERGKPTEVDHLNGEIVRRASLLGRDAPVNRMITELVHDAEAQRRAGRRDALSAEALFAKLR